MKVFLTTWILAVLIQEVISSTLVRLPRNAEKNLSLVHTEYEAKYEQKGKQGNESYSTVSGKQEIVHDNCAENWNSFAEKCASLIKDLVASLANAVSSKPGDATNLQLHIKNTFRHFDNTHNCTCFNHTGKSLSDLNLTPFFKNITVNTVGPNAKTDVENRPKKCGGKDQPCDRDQGSDINEDENVMLESPVSSDLGYDKNSQPLDELFVGNDDDTPQAGKDPKNKIFVEKLAEEQKQPNRALLDADDLDMHSENAEGLGDQSTNNNRRQIEYPQHLIKPQKIFKNPGDTDFNPFAHDSKLSSSNPKHPEGNKNIRYPFLVTPRQNPQSAKPLESPTVALNPASPSGPLLESDLPNSPDSEPYNVLLSQENTLPSVSPLSSAVKSNSGPSSASHLLNTSPNNNYLNPAPQVMMEPPSFSYNEEIPKEKLRSPNDPGLYQKPIIPPVKTLTSRNDTPPTMIFGEPITKSYDSEPEILVPAKLEKKKPYAQPPVALTEKQFTDTHNPETEVPLTSTGSESYPQSVRMLPEKGVTDRHHLHSVFIPAEQVENDRELVPLVTQSEKPGNNSQPIPQHPLFGSYSSDSETPLPVKPVDSEPNIQSPVILPQESLADSHVLKSGFIPAEQVENRPDAMPSVLKSEEQPLVMQPEKPETASYKSHPAKMIPADYKSIMNSPKMIPTSVPAENDQPIPLPLDLLKSIQSELPALIPENSAEKDHNPELPLFTQNKKPVEEPIKEMLPLATPTKYNSDKISDQGNTKPAIKMNASREDDEILKEPPSLIPESISNKKLPPGLKNDIVTINPSPIYEHLPARSGSNPLSDAIGSFEDILPIASNEQPLFEKQTFTPIPNERDQIIGHNLDHMIPMIKPVPMMPEVPSQQLRSSTSVEEHFGDKPNQVTLPDAFISDQFAPATPEFNSPEKFSVNSQYPDTETVNDPIGKFRDPQKTIQEEMFTTSVSMYPEKIITVIPAADDRVNRQPPMFDRSSEGNESKGKDFPETKIPMASNIYSEASNIKDQQKQPDAIIVGNTLQNGEQNNPLIVYPEIAATTPIIIYPVKSLPIPSEQQSPENVRPVLVNTGFSDGNQEPELQEALFTTPVPIFPVKPNPMVPMIAEQQDNKNPIQPTVTAESHFTSDSANENEHPLKYAPAKDSGILHYPQVIVKPDKIPGQPNPGDHPLHRNDLNSVPSANSNSETIPIISAESQPETPVPKTPLKPAHPGVLVQNIEVLPHQEKEQNTLLLQPTTFQTTSEDPTPSQVNVPGLLTHTTSIPQDSDETIPVGSSTSLKTPIIHEHDDDDEEDCCSCESCTEEEITDPKQYKENACKNLEEARKELKAIFDKIKKKLKCGRKAPQTITAS